MRRQLKLQRQALLQRQQQAQQGQQQVEQKQQQGEQGQQLVEQQEEQEQQVEPGQQAEREQQQEEQGQEGEQVGHQQVEQGLQQDLGKQRSSQCSLLSAEERTRENTSALDDSLSDLDSSVPLDTSQDDTIDDIGDTTVGTDVTTGVCSDTTAETVDTAKDADDTTKDTDDTANGADNTANGADDTANGADDIANGADDIANGADDIANGADETANGADDTANGADGTANGADDTANGADGTAKDADRTASETTGMNGDLTSKTDDTTGEDGDDTSETDETTGMKSGNASEVDDTTGVKGDDTSKTDDTTGVNGGNACEVDTSSVDDDNTTKTYDADCDNTDKADDTVGVAGDNSDAATSFDDQRSGSDTAIDPINLGARSNTSAVSGVSSGCDTKGSIETRGLDTGAETGTVTGVTTLSNGSEAPEHSLDAKMGDLPDVFNDGAGLANYEIKEDVDVKSVVTDAEIDDDVSVKSEDDSNDIDNILGEDINGASNSLVSTDVAAGLSVIKHKDEEPEDTLGNFEPNNLIDAAVDSNEGGSENTSSVSHLILGETYHLAEGLQSGDSRSGGVVVNSKVLQCQKVHDRPDDVSHYEGDDPENRNVNSEVQRENHEKSLAEVTTGVQPDREDHDVESNEGNHEIETISTENSDGINVNEMEDSGKETHDGHTRSNELKVHQRKGVVKNTDSTVTVSFPDQLLMNSAKKQRSCGIKPPGFEKDTSSVTPVTGDDLDDNVSPLDGSKVTPRLIMSDGPIDEFEIVSGVREDGFDRDSCVSETGENPSELVKNSPELDKDSSGSAKPLSKPVKVMAKSAKAAPGSTKSTSGSVKGTSRTTKGLPGSTKGLPKSAKSTAKTSKSLPRSAKSSSKCVKGLSKSPKGLRGSAKISSKSVKGISKSAKGAPKSMKGLSESAKGPMPAKVSKLSLDSFESNDAQSPPPSDKSSSKHSQITKSGSKEITERNDGSPKFRTKPPVPRMTGEDNAILLHPESKTPVEATAKANKPLISKEFSSQVSANMVIPSVSGLDEHHPTSSVHKNYNTNSTDTGPSRESDAVPSTSENDSDIFNQVEGSHGNTVSKSSVLHGTEAPRLYLSDTSLSSVNTSACPSDTSQQLVIDDAAVMETCSDDETLPDVASMDGSSSGEPPTTVESSNIGLRDHDYGVVFNSDEVSDEPNDAEEVRDTLPSGESEIKTSDFTSKMSGQNENDSSASVVKSESSVNGVKGDDSCSEESSVRAPEGDGNSVTASSGVRNTGVASDNIVGDDPSDIAEKCSIAEKATGVEKEITDATKKSSVVGKKSTVAENETSVTANETSVTAIKTAVAAEKTSVEQKETIVDASKTADATKEVGDGVKKTKIAAVKSKITAEDSDATTGSIDLGSSSSVSITTSTTPISCTSVTPVDVSEPSPGADSQPTSTPSNTISSTPNTPTSVGPVSSSKSPISVSSVFNSIVPFSFPIATSTSTPLASATSPRAPSSSVSKPSGLVSPIHANSIASGSNISISPSSSTSTSAEPPKNSVDASVATGVADGTESNASNVASSTVIFAKEKLKKRKLYNRLATTLTPQMSLEAEEEGMNALKDRPGRRTRRSLSSIIGRSRKRGVAVTGDVTPVSFPSTSSLNSASKVASDAVHSDETKTGDGTSGSCNISDTKLVSDSASTDESVPVRKTVKKRNRSTAFKAKKAHSLNNAASLSDGSALEISVEASEKSASDELVSSKVNSSDNINDDLLATDKSTHVGKNNNDLSKKFSADVPADEQKDVRTSNSVISIQNENPSLSLDEDASKKTVQQNASEITGKMSSNTSLLNESKRKKTVKSSRKSSAISSCRETLDVAGITENATALPLDGKLAHEGPMRPAMAKKRTLLDRESGISDEFSEPKTKQRRKCSIKAQARLSNTIISTRMKAKLVDPNVSEESSNSVLPDSSGKLQATSPLALNSHVISESSVKFASTSTETSAVVPTSAVCEITPEASNPTLAPKRPRSSLSPCVNFAESSSMKKNKHSNEHSIVVDANQKLPPRRASLIQKSYSYMPVHRQTRQSESAFSASKSDVSTENSTSLFMSPVGNISPATRDGNLSLASQPIASELHSASVKSSVPSKSSKSSELLKFPCKSPGYTSSLELQSPPRKAASSAEANPASILRAATELLSRTSQKASETVAAMNSSPSSIIELRKSLKEVRDMLEEIDDNPENPTTPKSATNSPNLAKTPQSHDVAFKPRSTQTSILTLSRACQTARLPTAFSSSIQAVPLQAGAIAPQIRQSKSCASTQTVSSMPPRPVMHLPTRKLIPNKNQKDGPSSGSPIYQRCVECLRNGVYNITSSVFCDTCDVPLCVVPCFRAYHVLGKRTH